MTGKPTWARSPRGRHLENKPGRSRNRRRRIIARGEGPDKVAFGRSQLGPCWARTHDSSGESMQLMVVVEGMIERLLLWRRREQIDVMYDNERNKMTNSPSWIRDTANKGGGEGRLEEQPFPTQVRRTTRHQQRLEWHRWTRQAVLSTKG